MNYNKLYKKICSIEYTGGGYSEKHHIVPKCMNGSDKKSNIIRLTSKQHYIAHRILTKIYPNHDGITFAFSSMNLINNKDQSKRYISSSGYVKAKEELSKLQSKRLLGKGNPMYGKPSAMRGKKHTEESIKIMSNLQKGSNNTFYGKKHTRKTRDLISSKSLEHTPEMKLIRAKSSKLAWDSGKLDKVCKPFVDIKGNKYKSITECTKKTGIKRATVWRMINRGEFKRI